ncbi:hypothetical protein CEN50_15490 [Fischerella thermalis CCMEE 5268]|uniref:Uncharacterized protein n=1 Tax=Fischerella thermalis CCMEE 5268 TaxID=2019662 RepID=A0A2N6KEG4_9CYAN|nr:hypothetical protein CEN50_15490 [Fischerella thermalis CCMEE 5268]
MIEQRQSQRKTSQEQPLSLPRRGEVTFKSVIQATVLAQPNVKIPTPTEPPALCLLRNNFVKSDRLPLLLSKFSDWKEQATIKIVVFTCRPDATVNIQSRDTTLLG